MTIFSKLFGGRGGDPYAEGIALFEGGRYAEAATRLREAGALDDRSPRGSLAGFYLRKALMSEGRRLLRAGEPARALDDLRAAADAWPEFPDLQFFCGAAAGLAGDWSLALTAAREALRRNPDYCEARLLEATALQAQHRERESANSLDALVESGRRVPHRLLDVLARDGGFDATTLPNDLPRLLRQEVAGDALKDRLADAVARCQAGEWEQGLARLGELAAEHPRYPDIRAKHAAALFQVGRDDDALREVDASLAINGRYRTAVCLKGLILADQGDVAAAHDFLADAMPRTEGAAGRHEEIFLAYLRAVVAFLLGDVDASRRLLAGWDDLPHHFARAALLLAACDDADERPDRCLARLDELMELWTGDVELHFLALAYALTLGLTDRVEHGVAHWPGSAGQDQRLLLLRARLAVRMGLAPEAPDEVPPEAAADQPGAAAWQQLAIHRELRDGQPDTALSLAQSLIDVGTADEETGALWLVAAAAAGSAAAPPAAVWPDAWIVPLAGLWRRQGRGADAERLVEARRAVRPDQPRWWWASRGFWLGPVRRWIA